jgi:hypothetical protein
MLPMDYVVMDHRVLDLFCLAPERGGWRLMRPWLTAALDMRTRKFLAWVIVETPSSDSIAAVLRQVFAKFGLPEHLYWDNGRDFRCEFFEGSAAQRCTAGAITSLPEKWCGVLESVGVRVTHAIAYNARAKLIEPAFLNVSHFDRTLPEYCGHKPGTRPERLAAMLKEHEAWTAGERSTTPFRTIEEIAYLYSELLGKDLNEREHSGVGMEKVAPFGKAWHCPNSAWEILIKRVERRSISDEQLQIVFGKRRPLTIQHGEATMTFGGRKFHYRLSADPMKLLALEGRRVELGYDALDLSQGAIYSEGLFLGLASCPALRKMGEDSFIEDEIQRRRARKQVKQAIASIHRAVPVPSPEDALARRRAVAPVRIDPERPERPALLAQPLMDAAAAFKAEREFRFDQASAAIDVVRIPAEAPADESERFNFFGDENTGGCE